MREIKRGPGWKEQIICTSGHYTLSVHNLYDEISMPGKPRKPCKKNAALNVGIQVDLTQTMISNSAFRNILMAANIPLPSSLYHQYAKNR